jgi:type VI secretion system secreted protein Hcp
MAKDYFLMLDGIKGESADSKHKNEIDIESFSWGVSQTGAGHSGSGSGSGKVDVHDITIQKKMDKASPLLMLACCNGKHISKGKLTLRKAGETALEYLTMDLENVLVSNYQVAGSGEVPSESISLNFVKIKTEYWTQTDKGAKGENAAYSWDVSQNTKY